MSEVVYIATNTLLLLQDWAGEGASDIVSVLCGFITVLSGTMVLHGTREPEKLPSAGKAPTQADYVSSLALLVFWEIRLVKRIYFLCRLFCASSNIMGCAFKR